MSNDGHTVYYAHAHSRHRDTSFSLRERKVHDGIYECKLPHAQYQLFKNNRTRTVIMVDKLARYKPDVIFVNAPFWSDVAIELKKTSGAVLVYDILDYYEGFEDLAPYAARLHACHMDLLGYSDLVTHTAMLLKPDHDNTLYLPNACDYKHWDVPRTMGGKPGFYGSYAHWVDKDAIASIPNIQLIGHGTPIGPIAYDRLPRFASQWSCGLIPFKQMKMTHSVNPIKLYEYYALGLPVVSTSLNEINIIADSMPLDIKPLVIHDASQWMDAVASCSYSDNEDLIEERKLWAKGQTWEHRYQDVLSQLLSLTTRQT